MISLSECSAILNQVKGKRKYTDEEVRAIREMLIRLAELEYLESLNDKFNNK